MNSVAIIIGIDDYAHKPLSSAVNDARAFRQALLDLQLVSPSRITLMTAPLGDSQLLPTRDNIANKLYEFYDDGDRWDRLYFYFAGHGLLAFSGDKERICTAVMPIDVHDLKRDGSKLLDLDELRDRLRLTGPQEQFYCVDACREFAYDDRPKVGVLGWTNKSGPLGPARRQATLYAVSELGLAQASVGGQGQMTAHLLKALKSDTLAVQYSDVTGTWIINLQSLADYAKTAIREALGNQPAYLQQYQLPQLVAPDPQISPLRELPQVNKVPLTIHIDPEGVEADTRVTVSLRGVSLDQYGLPPNRNHEQLWLMPQHYLLTSESRLGPTDPARDVVDVRTEHEITVRVAPTSKGIEPEEITRGIEAVPTPAPLVVASPSLEYRSVKGFLGEKQGEIRAEAYESAVVIEVEGLEPPFVRRSSPEKLVERVPPGPYQVRFRLGTEVFNQATVYVKDGESVSAESTLAESPLVRESLELVDQPLPKVAYVSESIGQMQAGLVQTMLAIIGIKPFDVNQELFRQFTGLIYPRYQIEIGFRPLSVVVAVDGDRWAKSPSDVLADVRCRLVSGHEQNDMHETALPVDLNPLNRSALSGFQNWMPGQGLRRVALGLAQAPSRSFALEFEAGPFGRFRLTTASIIQRATVVTILLHSDLGMSISQNLMRLPGRNELYQDEFMPNVSYGRLLREVQLGQQLYRSGELVSQALSPEGSDLMRELLYAKWSDPILSCMGFFGLQRDSHHFSEPWLLEQTARNLNGLFGELPDSRVAYGLEFEEERDAVYAQLLTQDDVPVLAESARILARYAERHGGDAARVARIARRIPANEIWSLIRVGGAGS